MLYRIETVCRLGAPRVVNVSLLWPTVLDGPLFTPLLKVFIGHAGHAGAEGKGNLYIEAKATFGPLMDIMGNIWEI